MLNEDKKIRDSQLFDLTNDAKILARDVANETFEEAKTLLDEYNGQI